MVGVEVGASAGVERLLLRSGLRATAPAPCPSGRGGTWDQRSLLQLARCRKLRMR